MKKTTSATLLALIFALMAGPAFADEGAAIYDHWCAHCHAPTPFAAGTNRLATTRGRDLSVLTNRTDMTPEYVRTVVRAGLGGMPSFRKTEISDQQLGTLASYLSRAKE